MNTVTISAITDIAGMGLADKIITIIVSAHLIGEKLTAPAADFLRRG